MFIEKEDLEKILGYKIQEFNIEPVYINEKLTSISINVIPIQSLKEIKTIGIINDLNNNTNDN